MAKGDYSVPENIRKMKPKGTMVKKIHDKYYVYEHYNRKNDEGKWHTVSGKMIGSIDPVDGFIPNDNYLHIDEITTLNYGEYALVINNTRNVIDRLLRFFNPKDAYRIYIMSVIHFVHNFTYLKNIKKYYDQSYFSIIYPNYAFGYESLGQLLDDLGRKQTRSLQFEQSLIDDSSSEIAIDGHVIPSSSHDNELAQKGYKFSNIKDSQINVLMGYDVNTNTPLFSRIYEGGNLDKISIKDVLQRYTFKNVRFIVDRGFYSKENIELFSSDNNQYIIPLSPNLTSYKEITENMNLERDFVYEESKKNTVINYREDIKDGKRVIVYRDSNQNAIDKAKYLKNMKEKPEKYTKEKYDKIKDFFGVIVIETNIMDMSAEEIYDLYKKRWKIETYFDYFKNKTGYKALSLKDYYKTEGLAFIMLVTGLIHSEMEKTMAASTIKGKTIDDCLIDAAFIKIHKSGTKWRIENILQKTKNMMEELNVYFDKEREFINK